jgi:F0F1-type ATP synthase alpha subunit
VVLAFNKNLLLILLTMFKTFRNLTAAELEALTNLRSTVFSKDTQVDRKFDENESGRVVTVGDGIAKVYGLKNVTASEMLEFESGVRGLALNLEYDSVRAILLGDERLVKVGDKV